MVKKYYNKTTHIETKIRKQIRIITVTGLKFTGKDIIEVQNWEDFIYLMGTDQFLYQLQGTLYIIADNVAWIYRGTPKWKNGGKEGMRKSEDIKTRRKKRKVNTKKNKNNKHYANNNKNTNTSRSITHIRHAIHSISTKKRTKIRTQKHMGMGKKLSQIPVQKTWNNQRSSTINTRITTSNDYNSRHTTKQKSANAHILNRNDDNVSIHKLYAMDNTRKTRNSKSQTIKKMKLIWGEKQWDI